MPIIAIVGNKGGAGKTTLSVNLASGLSQNNSAVILDADPQGSSLQWRVFAEKEDAVSVHKANGNLEQQAKELAETHDYVVIDCPPSVHAPQTNQALGVADKAVIPVQPSPMDLWATVHIEEAVDEASKTNESLKALLVVNQLEPRTTISKLVREAVNEIGLPVAEIALRRRAVYRTAILEGKSIYDMGRRGADAVEELDQLIQEVRN